MVNPARRRWNLQSDITVELRIIRTINGAKCSGPQFGTHLETTDPFKSWPGGSLRNRRHRSLDGSRGSRVVDADCHRRATKGLPQCLQRASSDNLSSRSSLTAIGHGQVSFKGMFHQMHVPREVGSGRSISLGL